MLSRRTLLRSSAASALALTAAGQFVSAETQPAKLSPVPTGLVKPAPAARALAHMAQATEATGPDRMRIERLAGLARLWGKVKFLHPYLAHKDIDWDAALVEAIPRVRAAASADEYRAAIADMLRVLQDPATTVLDAPADIALPPALDNGAQAPAAYRVVDGVAILHCVAAARLAASKGSNAVPTPQELGKAKGVVFDCRSGGTSDPAILATYLRACVEGVVSRTVTLGSRRYREHTGYAAQDGSSNNVYRSRLVVDAPAVWVGQWRNGEGPPLAFVIDAAAHLLSPYLPLRQMLSGLQAAGLATVVEQSSASDTRDNGSETSDVIELPDGVRASIRTVEFVGASGESAVQPDVTITVAPAGAVDPALEAALHSLAESAPKRRTPQAHAPLVPRGHWEKPYAETACPDTEHRLLALFRFWNVIDWFFPYRDLMDRDWGGALVEFIPKFEACRDEVEYQETVFALAARLQDSHVYVENARAMEKRHGEFGPPIAVRSIEGQTVITALRDDGAARAFGPEVGDVILAIDDRPIDELRASLAPPIAASTPQALRRIVDAWMLRGAKDSVAKLRLENANGSIRDVAIPRSAPWPSVAFEPGRTVPAVYQILPSGYGYVDLARLHYEDADKAIDAMLDTPALIFDMRGYPNRTVWSIAPRLAVTDRKIVGSLIRIRLLLGSYEDRAWVALDQTLTSTTKPRYRGKVTVLINEQAISQAEHTCLCFAAATDVTFIGSPTMGANGEVTKVVLPGDLTVQFTGMEIRHADGRQLQRVGVQPHVRVECTIRGLREGRDEVLEAAVAYLQRTVGK